MKTIDEIRKTDKFNIGSEQIPCLTILQEFFGDGLVAVAHRAGPCYTVRVAYYNNHRPTKLTDHLVRIPLFTRDDEPRVKIIETTVIHDWTNRKVA